MIADGGYDSDPLRERLARRHSDSAHILVGSNCAFFGKISELGDEHKLISLTRHRFFSGPGQLDGFRSV